MLIKLDKAKITREQREAMFQLYMHEDVIPFMTFEHMSYDDFMPILDHLLDDSDVYVYENSDQTIVGTARVERASGPNAHVVEICSVVVSQHEDHLRKGHGTRMLTSLIDLVERGGEDKEYQSVKRIELYVETDNNKAPYFYENLGFNYELTYDDLFLRKTGTHAGLWYAGSMYMTKLIGDLPIAPITDSDKAKKPTIEITPQFKFSSEQANKKLELKVNHEDQTVISISCQQLERRLLNMGILTNFSYNAQYAPQVIADAIRQMLPMLYERGIRHLQIQIPEGIASSMQIFETAGFMLKGSLLARYKADDSEYYSNVYVLAARLFNLDETLEYIEKSKFYKKSECKAVLQDALLALKEQLKTVTDPADRLFIEKSIYLALDSVAEREISDYTKRHLISRQEEEKINDINEVFQKCEPLAKDEETNRQLGKIKQMLVSIVHSQHQKDESPSIKVKAELQMQSQNNLRESQHIHTIE